MTWRTPCVEDPEMWTSDLADARAYALEQCREHCHRILECHAQTETDRANKLPVIGVSGGVDYTPGIRSKARTGTCQNPECGKPIPSPIARRRYCDDRCRSRAKYLLTRKRAA